ncbi:MAG: hypothetical protein Q9214_006357, partial [Letrouitia sp. 1 TL-2023]
RDIPLLFIFLASIHAATIPPSPPPLVSQISDGQVQGPTAAPFPPPSSGAMEGFLLTLGTPATLTQPVGVSSWDTSASPTLTTEVTISGSPMTVILGPTNTPIPLMTITENNGAVIECIRTTYSVQGPRTGCVSGWQQTIKTAASGTMTPYSGSPSGNPAPKTGGGPVGAPGGTNAPGGPVNTNTAQGPGGTMGGINSGAPSQPFTASNLNPGGTNAGGVLPETTNEGNPINTNTPQVHGGTTGGGTGGALHPTLAGSGPGATRAGGAPSEASTGGTPLKTTGEGPVGTNTGEPPVGTGTGGKISANPDGTITGGTLLGTNTGGAPGQTTGRAPSLSTGKNAEQASNGGTAGGTNPGGNKPTSNGPGAPTNGGTPGNTGALVTTPAPGATPTQPDIFANPSDTQTVITASGITGTFVKETLSGYASLTGTTTIATQSPVTEPDGSTSQTSFPVIIGPGGVHWGNAGGGGGGGG